MPPRHSKSLKPETVALLERSKGIQGSVPVAISPDGRFIASGRQDCPRVGLGRKLVAWSKRSKGIQVPVNPLQSGRAFHCFFFFQEAKTVSRLVRPTSYLGKRETGRSIKMRELPHAVMNLVAFSPDGRFRFGRLPRNSHSDRQCLEAGNDSPSQNIRNTSSVGSLSPQSGRTLHCFRRKIWQYSYYLE